MLAAWEDMVDGKTYITGGVGSDRAHEAFGAPFEIAPASAYAETCAAIASVFWNWRLLQATGEVRFADLLERTLYNGVLVGVAFDRSAYSYWNTLHGTPGPAPVVRLRVLPAEPDAAARVAAHLPRHRRRRRADDPPVRDRHGAEERACARRTRGTGRIEIDADRPVRLRVPAWSAHARLNGGRSRPGTWTRPRPQHARSRHAPERDRGRPARGRRSAATWRSSAARSCSAWRRGTSCRTRSPSASLRVWIPQKVSRQSVWAASRPSTASAPT